MVRLAVTFGKSEQVPRLEPLLPKERVTCRYRISPFRRQAKSAACRTALTSGGSRRHKWWVEPSGQSNPPGHKCEALQLQDLDPRQELLRLLRPLTARSSTPWSF